MLPTARGRSPLLESARPSEPPPRRDDERTRVSKRIGESFSHEPYKEDLAQYKQRPSSVVLGERGGFEQ
jgi:hypothetical protein